MDPALKRAARFLAARPVAIALAGLLFSYLALEWLFLGTRVFGTDEFRHLEQIKAITSQVPYAEVDIVKTLLGLYVQAPLYHLVGDTVLVVGALKLQIAIAVAASFWWIGRDLERWLGGAAAVCGVVLFLSMPEVLERSTEVRVDMLSALAGSISALLLCSQRWRASGIWLAVALLCTQKAAYFAVAIGFALAVFTAVSWRSSRRMGLRATLAVVGWSSAIVAAYVLLFAAIAGPAEVWNDLVVRALEWGEMSGERRGLYKNLDRFWWASLRGHWGLYALAALGWLACLARARKSRSHLLLAAFAPVFVILCLRHSEPWHYFLVVPAPVLAILGAVAVSEIWKLAVAYRWSVALFAGAFLAYTIAIPGPAVTRNLAYTNEYQHYNIELAAAILGPDDTYLDGVGMVTKRDHVDIPELAWLDKMYLRRVKRLDRARAAAIVETLERDPPLVLIRNYRTASLPSWLRRHIDSHYTKLHAAVAVYAPRFESGSAQLPRAGRYRVVADKAVVIDGRSREPGDVVELAAGEISIESDGAVRLVTETQVELDQSMAETKRIFRHVTR